MVARTKLCGLSAAAWDRPVIKGVGKSAFNLSKRHNSRRRDGRKAGFPAGAIMDRKSENQTFGLSGPSKRLATGPPIQAGSPAAFSTAITIRERLAAVMPR